MSQLAVEEVMATLRRLGIPEDPLPGCFHAGLGAQLTRPPRAYAGFTRLSRRDG